MGRYLKSRIAVGAEAVRTADALGYPVALKISSEHIGHKSDVGGVMLNLRDAAAVREGFRRIMEETKIYKVLKGYRHLPTSSGWKRF
ncbi:MAG: acetate--CoA ligase family protein [Desulfobacterales bacterium]